MEDDDSDDLHPGEPKVTSEDPNERKLARRLRIQRRLERARRQKLEQADITEEEALNPVQQQILKSYELLEKYIIQGDEYITTVRVANDSKEVDRRDREGLTREKIINDLEEEARLAVEKYEEIQDKWSEILRYNDPLHINDGILAQKELANDLIAQKDALIASLKLELKHAERVFGDDQRKQVEDITVLSQRIEKQVMFMRQMYNRELEAIESVMVAERDKLIEESRKRWEELYKRRDEDEQRNADEREEAARNFLIQQKRLRIEFQEKYRATKIRIEREIEELQKELRSIKALTLLNNEKLDYNYQILKKREDENIRIKSQQKRRINKLRDLVIFWRNKIKEYKINSLNQIAKLEADIKKLNVCILEVESKADYFALVNNRKFDQILQMNKKDAEQVLRRIMEVDRILHVQQLGIPWNSFETNLRFFAYERIKNKTTVDVNVAKSSSAFSLTSTHGEDLQVNRENAANIQKMNDSEGVTPAYCNLVKKILSMVADQTGFLAEEKLLEILKPYTDTQRTVVGIDNTFEALGIHKKEEVDLLVQYFLPFTICTICQSDSTTSQSVVEGPPTGRLSISRGDDYYESKIDMPRSSISMVVYAKSVEFSEVALINCIQENEKVYEEVLMNNILDDEFDELSTMSRHDKMSVVDMDTDSPFGKTARFKEILLETDVTAINAEENKVLLCAMDHPLSISPVHVVKALKQFVSAFYSGANQIVKKTIADRLAHVRETPSRILSEEEIRKFWQRYISAFPQEKKQLWNALFTGLKKYHSILKERRNLSMEVVELRKQNMELKQILSNYMHHSKIMDPPCGEPQAFHKGGKLKCLEKLRKIQ